MKRKNILFCTFVALIVFGICTGLFSCISCRINKKAIPVQLCPARSAVCLTFDDGPNSCYTPQLLDLLYDRQAVATFFLVGENFSGNEAIIKEMAACGHEICCHTFSHPDLTTLTQPQIQAEIQKTETKLKKILPDVTMQYLRPPYGRYSEKVKSASKLPLMLWSIDSGDWENPDEKKIYDTVLQNIQDGDIIVFHDDNLQTIKALEKIIPALQERGFQFITVSQMDKIKSIKQLG